MLEHDLRILSRKNVKLKPVTAITLNGHTSAGCVCPAFGPNNAHTKEKLYLVISGGAHREHF